jgi:hypothetical protein
MRPGPIALRLSALLTLAVWVGGFTFYGAVVIPILHDEMGVRATGFVTKRVTDAINVMGAITLAVWWLTVAIERSAGSARIRRAKLSLLIATTATLIFLAALHRVMDRRLDSGDFQDFYPLHRAYLIASTIQWLLNVGLMAASLVLWRDADTR